MSKTGLWKIENGFPNRLMESHIQLERHLEVWIEKDPNLLREGLTIIGRQVKIAGGKLDLLAIDPNGRLFLIEVKRDTIRRKTIAQILDYSSSLDLMSGEEIKVIIENYLKSKKSSIENIMENIDIDDVLKKENRDVTLIIVGSSKENGVERIINYLSKKFSIPISLVTFDVFSTRDENQILAREINEPVIAVLPENEDELKTYSNQENTYNEIQLFFKLAKRINIYARSYKKSVMLTPENNHNRMLFTVWAKPSKGKLLLYFSPKAISEFYPINEEKIIKQGFSEGYLKLDKSEVETFISNVENLFQQINSIEND